MEYNTQRNQLIISEYGRNIQKMIDYISTVEDREKRNRMANAVVRIMGQMQSQVKDTGEFRQKLWDHLHIISDYRLDVDAPYPPPDPETLHSKPSKVSYPKRDLRFAHYGKNIELIIQKVIDMEDGPEKDRQIILIANHMKKSYLNWNRDSVNDEMILDHLAMLSRNQLQLKENAKLMNTSDILAKPPKKKFVPKQNGQNRNNKQRRNGKDKNHS